MLSSKPGIRKPLLALAVIAILGLAVGLALPHRSRTASTMTDANYIHLLQDVMTLVEMRYVDPLERPKLIRGAINGMLASLDPHSSYLPPESFTEMKVTTSGAFGGLGIEITLKEGRLTVISPIEDTPAYRVGIKSGDRIVRIDSLLTKGMTITEAVNRMRGQPGSKVTLTIFRDSFEQPRPFTITRDIIRLKSVKHRTIAPGIGYIRVAQFQERTGADFAAALAALHKENGGSIRGLVLDLRNNPGGLLDQAIQVANCFIGDDYRDSLIVSTKGRGSNAEAEYHATIGEKEPRYPLVILINGGSASASEIVAGALQDHRRAIVMGTQSFGKGSVQTIIPLRGNGGLLLTTARYYTPKGRSIQAEGIAPDIVVAQLDHSPSLRPEKMVIREKDLTNHMKPIELKEHPASTSPFPTPDQQMKSDYQLQRAVDLLRDLAVVTTASSR